MTYEAAILYAKQRMRELGFQPGEYHFEPVSITGTANERKNGLITIWSINQLHILVNHEIYYGFEILADNSGFNTEDINKSGVPEFTGLIEIKKIASSWSLEPKINDGTGKPIPIEFIRVVY